MRLASVEIPDNKRIEIALTYIFGIGRVTARRILHETKIENKLVSELTQEELQRIRDYIKFGGIEIEGELRTKIKMCIRRLQEIGCYRGIRHKKGLPVRGQNTKRNCRTRKGKKKTVPNKKKAEKK